MWRILRCMRRFGVRFKQENCVKCQPRERDGGLVGSTVNAKFTLGLVICRTVTPVQANATCSEDLLHSKSGSR